MASFSAMASTTHRIHVGLLFEVIDCGRHEGTSGDDVVGLGNAVLLPLLVDQFLKCGWIGHVVFFQSLCVNVEAA